MNQVLFADHSVAGRLEQPTLPHIGSIQMPKGQDQFEIFPDNISLSRVDPVRRMYRYYRMVAQRDLFGGASLIREWGRVGQSGKVCTQHHPDEGQAVNALIDVAATKRKRGYAP